MLDEEEITVQNAQPAEKHDSGCEGDFGRQGQESPCRCSTRLVYDPTSEGVRPMQTVDFEVKEDGRARFYGGRDEDGM